MERFGRHQAISDQKIIRAKRLHADDAQNERQGQGKGGTQARVEHALGVPVSDKVIAGEQDVSAPARHRPEAVGRQQHDNYGQKDAGDDRTPGFEKVVVGAGAVAAR